MNRRGASTVAIAGALVAAGAIALCHRQPPAPPVAAPPPPAVEQPRVIAHVGEREITNLALARFQRLKQLSEGMTGERQALDELCNRALLLEAARELSLDVGRPELDREVFRVEVVIGSIAAAAPASPRAAWTAPPVPSFAALDEPAAPRPPTPGSPLDRATELLAQSGIADDDLADEVKANLLAGKAAQQLVYDAIDVPRKELLAAAPPSPPPDAGTLEHVRRRLQHARGAPKLAALLADLRARFPVEIVN
jgi:hypothetical protein